MRRDTTATFSVSNADVADQLTEIAKRLARQADNPFRVEAYRRAADMLRALPKSVEQIHARHGVEGLMRLPGVGDSLGRRIAEILSRGQSKLLERLRLKQSNERLTSLPNIGPLLASRIQGRLGSDSLDEVFRAAYDGRLQQIEGVGRKRLRAIRESLSLRLNRQQPPRVLDESDAPPVSEILAVDRQYRSRAAKNSLPRVAPRRFNPTHAAWLPILRTQREGRRYVVHFSNTAACHELGHYGDWVVIHRVGKTRHGPWTVITAATGPLKGKRIVRGREAACREWYEELRRVQRQLPADGA